MRLVLLWACALIATLSSRSSFAMVLVPMCSEHAETVAAPPISRAARDDAPLAPQGCNGKNDPRVETRAPVPPPPGATMIELVPRLPPVFYRLPPAPCVLVPIESLVTGERAGYARTIERPPR